MANGQRAFTREFKAEAVHLVLTSGKSVAQIARDLGIHETVWHRGKRQLQHQADQAFPGKGHQTALEEENRRLQRENALLRQERDILKKALGICSQPQS